MKKMIYTVLFYFIVFQIASSSHIENIKKYSLTIQSIKPHLSDSSNKSKRSQYELTTEKSDSSDYSSKRSWLIAKNRLGIYLPVQNDNLIFMNSVVGLSILKKGENITYLTGNHFYDEPDHEMRVVNDKYIVYEMNTFGTNVAFVLPFGFGTELMSLSFRFRPIDGAFIETAMAMHASAGRSYNSRHISTGTVTGLGLMAYPQITARYYPWLSERKTVSVSLGLGRATSTIDVNESRGPTKETLSYTAGIGYDIPINGLGLIMFELKIVDSFQKGFRPMIVFPSISLRVVDTIFIGTLINPRWNKLF